MAEVPIDSVTNGIHTKTWISGDMASLYDRYLGGWDANVADASVWAGVEQIPDGELWRTHERRRERLVSFVRERVERQLRRRGASDDDLNRSREVLSPGALTIGFARRFATYKRASLLMRDPQRLRRILTDPERPVQLIFAGKAHPQDNPGKELIREIVHLARDPQLQRHIVFVEEYDMGVARRMVQGVDVWLNNPRRPKEASGTSGMKILANGGLNLSVLDGWWAEAYDGNNGWAIGNGEEYADAERGDRIEADLLLDLLENQVVPEFYERAADRLPRRWIHRMKASIGGLTAAFSTDRMLQDYTERLYLPAHREARLLAADDHQAARQRAARVERLDDGWSAVRVGDVAIDGPRDLPIGEELAIRAEVYLGELPPDDAAVEVFGGLVDGERRIIEGAVTAMTRVGEGHGAGWHAYAASWAPEAAGHSGCTVRVRPRFERPTPVHGFSMRAWGDG
jgi:starch phosphorylase